jgi:hypothetical protein
MGKAESCTAKTHGSGRCSVHEIGMFEIEHPEVLGMSQLLVMPEYEYQKQPSLTTQF